MNRMEKYLSNIITEEEVKSIAPGAFNVLAAPCGWGKTTFMFDDRILSLARAKKNVLYLVHNMVMREKIALSNPDNTAIFENADNLDGWFEHRAGKKFTLKEDDNKIRVMCYQTFAALLRREGDGWLQDIDLIIWDEFDDIRTYYKQEITRLKKALPAFSEERLAALLQEGNPNSVVNFVYQIKTCVLAPAKITLIAISASPERAAVYFKEYINYILEGQLEQKFYAQETIFVNGICDAIREKVIAVGKKYWCYTTYVHEGFRIANMSQAYGFHPLVLWSEKNERWRHLMTDERREALRCIEEERDLPPEYDMVIITAVGGRGVNIYDTSFQDWICDSEVYEDIVQYMRARFCPARQYLLEKTRGLIDFEQKGFPIDYYEWHTIEELRELIKDKPIFSIDGDGKRFQTFNAAKKAYPDLFETRKYGKSRTTQYRIKPAV